ncbi:MAG: TonB-dependent receptor [Alistipes sp.]|nr:TonB-dependent receptor [Alistipes sp.]
MKENKRQPGLLPGLLAFLLVSFAVTAANAQTNLAGTVKDASGQPMAGVTVIIDGQTRGTTTNVAGEFSLAVSQGDVLRFDFMGYNTEYVTVSGQTLVNVVMQESSTEIEQVVVMGYGAAVKRVDVIGSVSSVSSDAIAKRAPVNVFDALRGQMAGVQITSSSGAPGAGINIRVRGVSTLTDDGADPLYIVDGIIMDDISHISPNDIQSIDVLKDAASAAIYGSRAANGVVMITTKAGQEGQVRIDLRFNQSFGYLANKVPQLNNKESQIFLNTVISANSKDQFDWFSTATDSLGYNNFTSYDYQDIISQVAKRSDVGLSASGGTDKLKYYTSLGFLDETGVIVTSYNKRFNFQARTDYRPSRIFRVSTNVQASYREYKNVNESNTFYNALRRVPYTLLFFPTDGQYVGAFHSYPNNGRRNPLIEINERQDKTKRYDVTLNEEMQLFITPDLSVVGRATASFYFSDREQYNSPWIQTSKDLTDGGLDELTLTDRFYQRYQVEAFANYSRRFEDHFVSGMFGGSIEDLSLKTTTSGGRYLMDSDIRVPQASAEPKTTTVTPGVGNSMASMFGRVEYNYKSRYLFSATLRYDGSSRFGSENRWGLFPAVQGGWRFSDHFKDTPAGPIINNGMLRISWGKVGNDRIGNYDAQSLLTGTIGNGYAGFPGTVSTSKYGNPYLKWETTTSTNFGLDMTFLQGRMRFTADYYIKKTKDMLDDDFIPSELGFSTMRINIGSVENKGIELSLGATVIDKGDWYWETSVNWSKNKNKVLKIAGEGGRILTHGGVTGWYVEPGMSAGLFYGFKHLGVYAYDASNAYTSDFKERLVPVFDRDSYGNVRFDSNREPILIGYQYKNGKSYDGQVAKLTINGVEAKGGDVIWDDYNLDGDITDDDRQVLGSAYPDWFGGWNNTVSWKNFSLDFSFYYNKGGLVYNHLLWQLSRYGDNTSNADPRAVIQGWRFQGQQTDWFIPGQNAHATDNGRQVSSFYLEDGSFLRLTNVRLSYRFPQGIANKVFTKGIQIYVYGNNLLTWTDYRGYDPEIGSSAVLTPGLDNQTYPRQREFGFGFNINF